MRKYKPKKPRVDRPPPPWVAGLMAERPPWDCSQLLKDAWHHEADWDVPLDGRQMDQTHALCAAYKRDFQQFIFKELDERWGIESAKAAVYFVNIYADLPAPLDKRQKLDFDKHWLPTETAAQTVGIIRQIFWDYWRRRRRSPQLFEFLTAEELAAIYVSERLGLTVSPNSAKRRKERNRKRRP